MAYVRRAVRARPTVRGSSCGGWRAAVRAGGRANAIVGFHGGVLKLTVTPPPERGKANRAVIALLAKRLGLAAGAVEIVSGAGSPDKVVELPIDRDRLLDRLRAG